MQLRLAFSVPKFTGSGFNQTTSAILTGVTIAGAFSTVIFNSTNTKDKLGDAFKSFGSLLANTPLYEGIKNLALTYKNWGTTLVAKKDEFKQWVKDYLNASGFKSGAVELYTKLYDWATIVYEWFRDKFLVFLSRIPEMVENWKKLRLSLFKWGTFLGGGGGSALWAMFGSGDNWGRLAELMGDEDFNKAVEKFGELIEENPKAFENMGEEAMQEILQKIMDDPKDAAEIAEELLKDQQERKEKNKEKQEEEKEEEELKAEEIREAYAGQKSGKPQDSQEALSGFIEAGLKEFLTEKNNFKSAFEISRTALQEHLKHLENESKGNSKTAQVKKEFLKAINENEETKNKLINTFARLSEQAYNTYSRYNTEKTPQPKWLESIFKDLMKDEFTREAGKDEEGDAEKINDIVILKQQKNVKKK